MAAILDVLSAGTCAAGGQRLFGEEGSKRERDLACGALLNASRALRVWKYLIRDGLYLGDSKRKLLSVLGPPPGQQL